VPHDDQRYPVGNEIVLDGAAIDFEDGLVPDTACLWSSDIDGPLGRGPRLCALPLSEGRHRITLTVVDGDGNEAGQTAPPSRLAAGLVAAGVCLLLVAGVGMLAFALRGRKIAR
jgi:hypothetical protein